MPRVLSQCGASVVTFCAGCSQDEDVAEIAKFAVKEITEDFDQSNEWALQHVAKVQQTVRYLRGEKCVCQI